MIGLILFTCKLSDINNNNNQNTGYMNGKMLSEWANVAKTHFIVTDDTHCAYHNDQFRKYIVQNKEQFPCPIFQMDNDSIYPPRLMKPIVASQQQHGFPKSYIKKAKGPTTALFIPK